MALIHLLGVLAGTGITVWMQLQAVRDSILKPGCIFINFLMIVLMMTILRNLQIGYRAGVITSASLSLFPVAFNIYALELLTGSTLYTSFYIFLVVGTSVLVVNFLVMMSGAGAQVDDGKFVDESRFKDRWQGKKKKKSGNPYFGEKEKNWTPSNEGSPY